MNKQLLTTTVFYTQYAIYNESEILAIVKVTNDSKTCYEIEMLNKSPSELLNVYDYIRLEWR